jgi:ABC-type transporter MlaC component
MKYITKLKLAAIHQLCDAEDISTERMYQLMQDTVKVDIDVINNYLTNENHSKLFKELNQLLDIVIQFGYENKLDLGALSSKLDEALQKETKESLIMWINSKRNN